MRWKHLHNKLLTIAPGKYIFPLAISQTRKFKCVFLSESNQYIFVLFISFNKLKTDLKVFLEIFSSNQLKNNVLNFKNSKHPKFIEQVMASLILSKLQSIIVCLINNVFCI